MASLRAAAPAVADAIVQVAGGDLARAVQLSETLDPSWWRARRSEAHAAYPVKPELQRVVRAVLRERRDHPDPFASFPPLS